MPRFLYVGAVVLLCAPAAAWADTVATFNTLFGPVHVQLLDDVAPATVSNFLKYVSDGDYTNSFIHRSDPDFVIQGGGFRYSGPPLQVSSVPADPPVVNEFHESNLRGTIAMARVGGQVNSATSQWFFNMKDNVGLDNVDQGFTVFGRVMGNGMDVLEAIEAVPVYAFASPFGEVPLVNYSPQDYQTGVPVNVGNLVTIPSITYSLLGDASGDGKVDIFDVATISNQWGGTGSGDVNFDGAIDIFDVATVSSTWGDVIWTPGSASAVPEPATALALAAAVAALSLPAIRRRVLRRTGTD